MVQRSRFVMAVTAAGLLCAAGTARAQVEQEVVITAPRMPAGYEPVRRVVSIGDLDLATADGIRRMEGRVSEAVNSLCEINPPVGPVEEQDSRTCREQAWASARPQMEQATQRARR